MSESPRIDELKRRVQVDPASIAFAALAEEYRRAGRFEEAIATCQAGLQRHPAYLSAHVTLGRALLELGRFDEARVELEHVLRAAPENLAAIRGLAEIHHRRGELPEALEQYKSALQVAKHDAEIEQAVDEISKRVAPEPPAAPAPAATTLPAIPVHAAPAATPIPVATIPIEVTTAVAPQVEQEPELEIEPPAASEPAPVRESPREPLKWPASRPIELVKRPEPAAPVEPPVPDLVTWAQPPQTVPAPDPTLLALEGLLAAILRAKDDLTVRSHAR